MKFGILYNIDYHKEVHGDPSQYYEDILAQVVRAEELGYHSVWFGEHHYADYSFGAPAEMALAAASRTTRLSVGTGVATLPLHHPILMAEEYGLLDVLSKGRLEFGVGRGYLKYGYDVLGVSEEESIERYRESLEIIMKAWSSEGPFTHQGKFWDVLEYKVFPPPYQKPIPRIFATGASTADSYTWAGSMGTHLATAFFLPQQELVRNGIRSYRSELEKQGIDSAERDVLGVMPMYCAEDREEALEAFDHTLNYFKFFASLDQRSPHRAKDYDAYIKGASTQYSAASFDDFDKANLVMIGEPENLVRKVEWILDYFDHPTYLLFEVAQGGMPPKKVIPTLERFAREVMPQFQ